MIIICKWQWINIYLRNCTLYVLRIRSSFSYPLQNGTRVFLLQTVNCLFSFHLLFICVSFMHCETFCFVYFFLFSLHSHQTNFFYYFTLKLFFNHFHTKSSIVNVLTMVFFSKRKCPSFFFIYLIFQTQVWVDYFVFFLVWTLTKFNFPYN